MTPDGSVKWQLQQLENIGAAVLHAPDCHPDIVQFLIETSQDSARYRADRIKLNQRGSSGVFGTVYDETIAGQALALKLFFMPTYARTEPHQGLSGLRANVAVAAGLRKLALSGGDIFMSRTVRQLPEPVPFKLLMPRYFAAVLPFSTSTERLTTAWAMSYEARDRFEEYRLHTPNYADYAAVLDAACKTVGLQPKQVDYDMRNGFGNIMLRRGEGDIATEVIKIDNVASDPLDFKSVLSPDSQNASKSEAL